MLVRDRMTSPAKTVRPDSSFQDALQMMREGNFRRLPVVDDHGKLVGIVAERDLLHAAPSPATSLSVWEVNYLLWKLRVADLMTTHVVSVSPEIPVEDAAQIMVSRKIGGLPVVDSAGQVIGVITETDIFKAFTELFRGSEHGLRVMVRVPATKGTLARITQVIADMGGNIVSLGTFDDKTEQTRKLLMKVTGVSKEDLAAGLAAIGDEVLDARIV
jgi:acetoin utilization protein AcuB